MATRTRSGLQRAGSTVAPAAAEERKTRGQKRKTVDSKSAAAGSQDSDNDVEMEAPSDVKEPAAKRRRAASPKRPAASRASSLLAVPSAAVAGSGVALGSSGSGSGVLTSGVPVKSGSSSNPAAPVQRSEGGGRLAVPDTAATFAEGAGAGTRSVSGGAGSAGSAAAPRSLSGSETWQPKLDAVTTAFKSLTGGPEPAAAAKQFQLTLAAKVTPSCPLPERIDLSDPSRLVTAFGRNKECTVVLLSKINVGCISRQHAKIVRDAEDASKFTLIDTESKNGVFVNDKKVQSAVLRRGDVIVFGGPSNTKVGQFQPQPESEFVYRFDAVGDGEGKGGAGSSGGGGEEEGSVITQTFDTMKTLTDNVTVLATWFTGFSLLFGTLFGGAESEAFAFMRDNVGPYFAAVGLPFTKVTLVAALLLALLLALVAFVCVKRRRR